MQPIYLVRRVLHIWPITHHLAGTRAARERTTIFMETTRDVSRRWTQKAGRAAAAAIVLGATMASPASVSVADPPAGREAGGKASRTVQVSGQLVPADLDAGTYTVTGELIGTWTFPPDQTETYYKSSTRLYQKGTEYFEGCVNLNGNRKCDPSEPSGRWQSDYIYWAFFDDDERLIEGGCVHPITGGNKAFTGVRGLLRMTDVYASTKAGSTAIYQGEVVLNAVEEKPVAKPASIGIGALTSEGRAMAGC